jgi:hypothetical protein
MQAEFKTAQEKNSTAGPLALMRNTGRPPASCSGAPYDIDSPRAWSRCICTIDARLKSVSVKQAGQTFRPGA